MRTHPVDLAPAVGGPPAAGDPDPDGLSVGADIEADSSTGVSIGTVVGLVLVAFGLIIGVRELSDNSFLTHLATGRLMLDDGFVRHDAFTWTAAGEPVVVQSWLASLIYAAVEELSGGAGIRVLTGLVCLLLSAGIWTATRSMHGVVARVAVAGSVIFIGGSFWTHRPLIFGLLGLLAVVLVLEGRWSPTVLIPVMYFWVQLHGSFPMGIGLAVCVLIGTKLDGRPIDLPRRAVTMAAAGVALGGLLNPYGPKLVVFPVSMLGRDDMLQYVKEWRSPELRMWFARVFLLMLLACIVALMRSATWRRAIPVLVFAASAFMAQRNIPLATLVMIPALVDGFGELGGIRSDQRRSIFRPAAWVLVAGLLVIGAASTTGPAYDLDRYPVAEVEWLAARDLLSAEHHIVHPDIVGNYIEWAEGTEAAVFVDDRYELHSRAVFNDYLTIDDGRPGWDDVLADREVEIVLWPASSPLVELLRLSDSWEFALESDSWVVVCRSGVCPGAA